MTLTAVLTTTSGIAAAGAAVTGLRAARLWYRASLVSAAPVWGPSASQPVDPVQAQQGWTVGILAAGSEAGELNARAARWTAAAVILAAVQSFAGFLIAALA